MISTLQKWLSGIGDRFREKNVYRSSLVAKRFIKLFIDHGLNTNQIPRLVPQLSLSDLTSEESLLKALTPQILDAVAELFSIQAGWLDGSADEIYPAWSCYKDPQKFFDLLQHLDVSPQDFAFRVFTTADTLSCLDPQSQPVLIVLCQKLSIDTDPPLYKFYVDTEWNWADPECRIQLKALAMIYYQKFRCPIPIYKLIASDFSELAEWRCIPSTLINAGLLTTPSLEDYILDNSQSVVAKEVQELPQVREYVLQHHLTFGVTAEIETLETEFKADNSISEMTSKNAKARYVELDAIKANFIDFYNETKAKNRTASAKSFFNQLDQRSKLILVPTYEEHDLEATIKKAVRTLTNALRESKKKVVMD